MANLPGNIQQSGLTTNDYRYSPRILVSFDKFYQNWDTKTPIGNGAIPYIYISYSGLDFSPLEAKSKVQKFLREHSNLGICFWIDTACLSPSSQPGDLLDKDLFQMGNTIRGATRTIILVKGVNNDYSDMQNPVVWKNWKRRLWSFPEVFYSSELYVLFAKSDHQNNFLQYMKSSDFIKEVYLTDEYEYGYVSTSSIYSHLKTRVLRTGDRLNLLLSLLNYRRLHMLTLGSNGRKSFALFPDYPAEVVYVAMAFFESSDRIMPDRTETVENAYARFINNIKLKNAKFDFSATPTAIKDFVLVHLRRNGFALGSLDKPSETFLPKSICVYDETLQDWTLESNDSKISDTKYIAISYVQGDFSPKAIKGVARQLLENDSQFSNINAYWLDVECGDNVNVERDLFCMSDIFVGAAAIVVCISGKGRHGHVDPDAIKPLSYGWSKWGERLWTLPEAILAKKLYCVVDGAAPQEISPHQLVYKAYGEMPCEKKLMNIYHSKIAATFDQHLSAIIEALARRTSSNLLSLSRSVSVAPTHANSIGTQGYEAERIYALMGFLFNRVDPRKGEDENTALVRLLKVNGIDGDDFLKRNFPSGDLTSSIYSDYQGAMAN